ncbi:MAG: peptide deformylase, partial [Parcubacteria group bacterium]|nr:peptide deformylase [Parcubacteria group bacterium]
MKLPLVYYPDPRLNEPSKKLVPDSDRGVGHVSAVQKLCSDLIDTMEAEKGIGISAIQIGEPVRVGIIHKDAGIPPFAKG